MNKYKIATKAYHKLGDISRDEPDLCEIFEDDEDNYYGEWITGFGFIDVCFPKETTRDLTEDEIRQYVGTSIAINNNPPLFTFTEEELRTEIELEYD